MKKNIFKTKAFPIIMLSAACTGVLAACLFAGRENRQKFCPAEPAPGEIVREWQDPAASPVPQRQPDAPASAGSSTENGISPYMPAQGGTDKDVAEAYPQVTEETGQLVSIDFTPEAEKLHPEPPEAPTAGENATNPDQPPAYTPEELEPEPSAPPAQPDTPAPGASNGNGAVYDPVFGWVVPGEINQIPMDSAGDPNKMVGNM